MTFKKRKRAINFDVEHEIRPDKPQQLSQAEKAEREKERICKLIPKDCEYVPLFVYLKRNAEKLPEISNYESELGKVSRLCFEYSIAIKRISSPHYGTVFVFPINFLDVIYKNKLI